MSEEVVAEQPASDSLSTDQETSAQTDDLDTLLSQFDQEFKQDTETSQDGEPDKVDELAKKVEYFEQKEVTADIGSAVSIVKEAIADDLPVNLSGRAVRGILNDMAATDERMMGAFVNRHTNPTAWERVLNAAAAEIKKDFGEPVDRGLTADRDAVANTIKGTSTVTEDDPPNFNDMNDRDFEAWKRKHR